MELGRSAESDLAAMFKSDPETTIRVDINPPWLKWLRRASGRSNLGLYWHPVHEVLVFGLWHTDRIIQELEVVPDPQAPWPWPSISPERMLKRLQPLDSFLKANMALMNQHREKQRELQDSNMEERLEQAQFHRRRGRELTARLFEECVMPYASKYEIESMNLPEF